MLNVIKPSLNSFFLYDFVLAIDCNQLLLIERFSYDFETKTREQNRNIKQWGHDLILSSTDW